MSDSPYLIQPFKKALHDRGAFSCGVAPMDKWLKESISDQIKHHRVNVWCAVEREPFETDGQAPVAGFYGLCMHCVEPDQAPALRWRGDRHQIPAAYLTAIATDKAHQGGGLGGALMADAIKRCIQASESVGTAAVVLDVFEDDEFDRRMAFYTRIGFAPLDPENNPPRLFLGIKDAVASAV